MDWINSLFRGTLFRMWPPKNNLVVQKILSKTHKYFIRKRLNVRDYLPIKLWEEQGQCRSQRHSAMFEEIKQCLENLWLKTIVGSPLEVPTSHRPQLLLLYYVEFPLFPSHSDIYAFHYLNLDRNSAGKRVWEIRFSGTSVIREISVESQGYYWGSTNFSHGCPILPSPWH